MNAHIRLGFILFLAVQSLAIQTHAASPNRVLALNGWPDYVSLSKPLPDLTNATFEAWVCYSGGTTPGVILSDSTTDYASDFNFSMTGSSVIIRADKSGGTLGNTDYLGASAGNLNLANAWHHVAWVMTPTNSSVYFDGVRIREFQEPASNIGCHAANPRIGGWWDNYEWDPGIDRYNWIREWGFVGKMDELRIWDVPLSSQQLLSNMYRKLSGAENGLVAYYNFDDGTANDLSSSTNHGVMSGSATTQAEELPAGLEIALYPGLTLTGTSGTSYRVEYLDALQVTSGWQTLTNITIPYTPFRVIDETAPLPARRFYRAVVP